MNAFLQAWLRLAQSAMAGVMGILLLGGLLAAVPEKAHGAVFADPEAVTVQTSPTCRAASQTVVFGAWYNNVLGDRSRMIQVALIFMMIGIAFLMWGKDK